MLRRALGIIAIFLASVADAGATTRASRKRACPIDGTEVDAYSVISSNNFEGQDTDLLVRAAGGTPFTITITTCPKCGFTGYAGDFLQLPDDATSPDEPAGDSIDEAVRKAVLAGALKVPSGGDALPAWARYDLLAQLQTLQGAPPSRLAATWLHAAWSVRLAGDGWRLFLEPLDEQTRKATWDKLQPPEDRVKARADVSGSEVDIVRRMLPKLDEVPATERVAVIRYVAFLARHRGEHALARRAMAALVPLLDEAEGKRVSNALDASIAREEGYQRKAIAAFEAQLADESDKTPEEERLVVRYLIGELSRRTGDIDKARQAFKAVRSAAAPEWAVELATKQDALLGAGEK